MDFGYTNARVVVAGGGGGGMGASVVEQLRGLGAEIHVLDLAQRDIRLNVVLPGTTRTPMSAQMDDGSPSKHFADLAAAGMGRWAEAVEQAWPMIFLNSPLASYITGEAIAVDGGTAAGVVTGQIEAGFDTAALNELQS
jgi:enoyl-[acyl-carrier-protein] reductase (NADH)